ncbi:MAG: hypothetical protein AB7U73_21395 [Pirellulales bacterium]
MPLSLAGVDLLLPPADLVADLERRRPLGDLNLFGRLAWNERDTRSNSRAEMRAGRGVSIPNHSADPPLRLNTFYWPSGAGRFARGVFLADSARIPAILSATGSSASAPVPLVMADERSGQRVETNVYLLPLRPLFDVAGTNGIYLLPVVDERYWWQFANAGNLSVGPTTTWDDLFVSLATPLGLNLFAVAASNGSAAYGKPDAIEFSRPYENAAVLLDALAAAVGMTIARNWATGGLIIHSPGDAAAALDSTLATALRHPYRIGGHEEVSSAAHASAIPAAVDVVFPRYCGARPQCDGAVFTITKPAPGPAGPATTRKTFHSTAWANFASTIEASPANLAALDDLASQLASDYYGWASRRYDLSFAGFYPWPANAFDDWIIWRYGATDPEGAPTLASTRVLSRPLNFGVEEVAQQFADWPDYPEEIRVRLTTPLSAGGQASAVRQIWDPNVADWVDTGPTLTIKDYIGSMIGKIGDVGMARHWCDACAWELYQKNC